MLPARCFESEPTACDEDDLGEIMIAMLTGTLVLVDQNTVVVDVGGVGYEIEVPISTLAVLPGLSKTVTLHTHQGQRDDIPVLFGFNTRADRALFQAITKISGVGPKMGLAILSTFTLDELSRVAANGDVAALTQIPGVGKRTAERLAVELKNRLPDAPVTNRPASSQGSVAEARSALMALGYHERDAIKAVDAVSQDAETTEAMIRGALKLLAKTDGPVCRSQ